MAARAGLDLSPGATWALVHIDEHGLARARTLADESGAPPERVSAAVAELRRQGLLGGYGDAGLTAKSDVTLKTKARITLHVPRHVRSHGTARFRGSLKGRPLPPRGVTLELQAHQPGRGWRTVKTTRTRKGGAYSLLATMPGDPTAN